jgi:hypothetical protein
LYHCSSYIHTNSSSQFATLTHLQVNAHGHAIINSLESTIPSKKGEGNAGEACGAKPLGYIALGGGSMARDRQFWQAKL